MSGDSTSHGAVEHAGDAGKTDDLGAPERWGWHHEFKTGRQIGGWMTVLILLLLLTTTHYNRAGDIALILGAVCVAGGLLWDRHHRRTQWRS